jgi:hypothetical protein
MHAQLLALRQRDDDVSGGVLGGLEQRPKGPPSFRDRGFSFIPIREAHIEFLAEHVYGRTAPKIDEVIGNAMVDEFYLPVGVVLVHFQSNGRNVLHAHFGRWLKVYPKDILRGMKPVCNELREHGIFILHAMADESVEGSDTLLQWLGAAPTGERDDEIGPWYRLDLRECKI